MPTSAPTTPTELTDERLMEAIRKKGADSIIRAEDALEALLDRHRAQLRSIASQIMHDSADVDDIMQDVSIELWQKASAYDPLKGKVLGWMITLTRRRAIDRVRASQSRGGALDRATEEHQATGEQHQDGDTDLELADLGHALRDILGKLPAKQRDMARMSFLEGLSQREIASRTGIPLGTIKTRLELGLRKIRNLALQSGIGDLDSLPMPPPEGPHDLPATPIMLPSAGEIDRTLSDMMSKLQAAFEIVTPAQAREWLTHNTANRPPKASSIQSFANDMATGKWLPTPQGVGFDTSGMLVDGQNRLMAILKADQPALLLVVRGLPVSHAGIKTMDVIDQGARRSIADQLRISHNYVGNPNLTAATCAMIAQVMLKGHEVRRLSITQTLAVLALYGPSVDFIVRALVNQPDKLLRRKPLAGALAILHHTYAQDAERIVKVLIGTRLRSSKATTQEAADICAYLEQNSGSQGGSAARGNCEALLDLLFGCITPLRPGQQRATGLEHVRARQHQEVDQLHSLFLIKEKSDGPALRGDGGMVVNSLHPGIEAPAAQPLHLGAHEGHKSTGGKAQGHATPKDRPVRRRCRAKWPSGRTASAPSSGPQRRKESDPPGPVDIPEVTTADQAYDQWVKMMNNASAWTDAQRAAMWDRYEVLKAA